MKEKAYVGIDVAFAKNKRLPICVCVKYSNKLVPLPLINTDKYPRGRGNKLAINNNDVEKFADETFNYLKLIEKEQKIEIAKIAIDAPSSFRKEDSCRRLSEQALDKEKISCFATPSQKNFEKIIEKVKTHIVNRGQESKIPHANQLWMLAGFALFNKLKQHFNCIEVFPQAIVRALDCSKIHKTKKDGSLNQEKAAWKVTGWGDNEVKPSLKLCVYGSHHDKLDAYLSAWVASLPIEKLECYGDPNKDDAIWIPKCKIGDN
jgi:hypothetical protein